MNERRRGAAFGCLHVLVLPFVGLFILLTAPTVIVTGLSQTVTNRASVKSMVALEAFYETYAVDAMLGRIYMAQVKFGVTPQQIDPKPLQQALCGSIFRNG
ncbi:MAG: hypothetical protein R2873_34595 [Caldilineaceae bacterium]